MRTITAALILLAARLAAAQAVNVYLNDVKLDRGSVHDVTLNGVDVRFDERGDVHIVARGYKITATTVSQTVTPPLGGRHYYLVPSPQRRNGAAQWDVDVYINQTYVHRFRSRVPDPYVEVTRFLHAGANSVTFVAQKEPGPRGSTSTDDVFELGIGRGELDGGRLAFEPLATI